LDADRIHRRPVGDDLDRPRLGDANGPLQEPAGCLDTRCVDIFERWESQAAVETFRSSGPSNEQGAAMLSASVAEYDIAAMLHLVSPRHAEEATLTGSQIAKASSSNATANRRCTGSLTASSSCLGEGSGRTHARR
jgi:hypothetical protein